MLSVADSKHVGEIRALITNQGSWAVNRCVNTEHLVFSVIRTRSCLGRNSLCVLEAAKCCLWWTVSNKSTSQGDLCMKMKELGAHLPLDTADVQCWES